MKDELGVVVGSADSPCAEAVVRRRSPSFAGAVRRGGARPCE
ncbi:hypothetical protein [Nonomuraea sp. NPDC049709]